MTRVSLVLARARNGTIGHRGALPWRLPEDMAHFKHLTWGKPVIMGRKTWDSLPTKFRPLPARHNIVVTRQRDWQADGAQVARSVADALQLYPDADEVCVIGGAQIYAEALPLATHAHVTEIAHDFDGDVHFAPLPPEWREVSRQTHHSAAPNDFDYAFVTYEKTGAL
ncbi:MAG: dihydrofolate reductase [Betaproteobacteria bacterium]|nr:dihydrofolate reductase [Betaproteobacteria bacterium]